MCGDLVRLGLDYVHEGVFGISGGFEIRIIAVKSWFFVMVKSLSLERALAFGKL